jgi:hypothetical protein
MQPLDPKHQADSVFLQHQQIPQQERLQRGDGRRKARSSAVSPQIRAKTRIRTAAGWSVAVAVLSWMIVIATHVEWVRQHDGPSIHPISYFVPVTVSVLAAGFLLMLRQRKAGSIQDRPEGVGAAAQPISSEYVTGRPPEPDATMVRARRTGEGDDTTAGESSSQFDIDRPRAGIINIIGRDQYNRYVQKRDNFFREIAATKTKARWLVWTGFVAFVVGFGLFAAGVLGFLKQAGSAVETSDGVTSPFGPDIGGVPLGLLGWALAVLGMLLLVVGIVLHIVATSRRRRVDRELPVPPPWPAPGSRESDMATFNFSGDIHTEIMNNVGGDQHIPGGQHVTVVTALQARRAVRELWDGLTTTTLDESTAAEARAQLAEIDVAMQAPEPDRSRVEPFLKRLTQLLKAAGSLATASSSLIGPLHTLASWLGTLGEPILHMLSVLG